MIFSDVAINQTFRLLDDPGTMGRVWKKTSSSAAFQWDVGGIVQYRPTMMGAATPVQLVDLESRWVDVP